MTRPSRIVVAFFVGVLSFFIYVANLVVYEALSSMFSIVVSWQLVVLGALLGVGSGGFIVATIAGMRYYNMLTRVSYRVTAVWMGSLVYLFFACVVYGLLVPFPGLYPQVVGGVLVLGALAATVYGVSHARQIRVTEVTVSLPCLPEVWQGRRLVWVSDLHLGQLHGSRFARRVVQKVNALPHDIVCIGGDLYDGTGAPDIEELTAPLKELPGTGILRGTEPSVLIFPVISSPYLPSPRVAPSFRSPSS